MGLGRVEHGLFGRRRAAAACRGIEVVVLFASVGPAFAQSNGEVRITGGPDATGQMYEWTVSNHARSPVVYIEFPHYHGSLFFAPDGWTTESTFLVNVGVPDRPGVCAARASTPASGIPPGGKATFRLQLAPSGAARGVGDVLVRLADGRQLAVDGVALPTAAQGILKHAPLLALGSIFAVFLVVQAIRRKRAGPADAVREEA